jgi:hypothetical protein
MTRLLRCLLFILPLLLVSMSAFAGGPMAVGSPYIGDDGKIVTWATMPIVYHLDGGPMSSTINHSAAVTRVAKMFSVWSSVSTASVSFTNGGAIKSVADGDVSTLAEFNQVYAACDAGNETPVVLDADGSILKEMGVDDAVIGFSGLCKVDTSGHIDSAVLLMNGKWKDGINNDTNGELTDTQFDEAISHEIGHLLGLDHSQINVDLLWTGNPCSATDLIAGIPLMFPYAICSGRQALGLPVLAQDDKAWISKLYPSQSFDTSYGYIRGTIYFSDGYTQTQGVNVIARKVGDERRFALSVVSGFLFTGNPGQTVTAKYLKCNPPDAAGCVNGYYGDNSTGSQYGSRSTALIGYYEIPVPPGDYTVEVESVYNGFTSGSSVGPLDPPASNPGKNEFYSTPESANDDPADKATVHVNAGSATEGIDIILNNTPPRRDQFGVSLLLWPHEQGVNQEGACA